MRNLFLLGLMGLLAACGGPPQPTIPTIQPPTSATLAVPLSPVEFVQKELKEANFTQQGGEWGKKSENGDVFVTLTQKDSSIDVIARFVRSDGTAICQIHALKLAHVGRIESLNDVATAADLINRHSCQAI